MNIPHKIDKRIFIIIFLLFLLSVVIRLPRINKFSDGVWLPATVLRHMDIWNSSSIADYNFNPVMTYTNPGDRFINNHGRISDPNGIYYYNSYPPFGYIAPYGIFQLFNIDINPTNLRLFNMFFHLVCCFILFFILYEVFQNEIIAIAGMSLYLFSKIAMFCHSETYMSDFFVPWIYAAGVLLTLRIVSRKQTTIEQWLLPVVIFLMIYTEWLGVFFAFSLFLYGVFFKKGLHRKFFILSTVFSGIAAASLILFQYLQINSFAELIEAWSNIYAVRSGINSETVNVCDAKAYTEPTLAYWRNHGLVMLTLAFGLFVVLRNFHKQGKLKAMLNELKNNHALLLLYLTATPVILHHIFFFNFHSIHVHGTVMSLFIFSVAFSLLCYLVKNDEDIKSIRTLLFVPMTFFFILFFLVKLNTYYNKTAWIAPIWSIASLLIIFLCFFATAYITIKKRCNWKSFTLIILMFMCGVNIVEYRTAYNNKSSLYHDMGISIMKNARPDEIVILNIPDNPNFEIKPDLIFYAKRNAILYRNLNNPQIQAAIRKNKSAIGRIMTFEKGKLVNMKLISLAGGMIRP